MENRLPIMEFQDESQAYECLKEWQTRLFLTDWTIRLHLVEPDDLKDEDGKEFSGRNELEVTIKCALISIAKLDDDKRNRIQKVCHEQTLIHELLHCKYNWLNPSYTIEGKYYDTLEHSLLEQMSKSLLMAKYDLSFDWFKNFKEEDFKEPVFDGLFESSAEPRWIDINERLPTGT